MHLQHQDIYSRHTSEEYSVIYGIKHLKHPDICSICVSKELTYYARPLHICFRNIRFDKFCILPFHNKVISFITKVYAYLFCSIIRWDYGVKTYCSKSGHTSTIFLGGVGQWLISLGIIELSYICGPLPTPKKVKIRPYVWKFKIDFRFWQKTGFCFDQPVLTSHKVVVTINFTFSHFSSHFLCFDFFS